jgi:shikimate kinase
MRVALVGYMGSGKSFWGKKLAQRLKVPFVDLDEEIEKELQDTIYSFISSKGELAFRKMERESLHRLTKSAGNMVLATGGGTPCYYDNMEVLNASYKTIYLDCSIQELVERLEGEKEHRPIISHLEDGELKEFIAKHLFERRLFYHQAHHRIKTSNLQLKDVVELVKK